jgi:hypothetical protein
MRGLYSNDSVPRLGAYASNTSPAVTARTFTLSKSAPISVILIARSHLWSNITIRAQQPNSNLGALQLSDIKPDVNFAACDKQRSNLSNAHVFIGLLLLKKIQCFKTHNTYNKFKKRNHAIRNWKCLLHWVELKSFVESVITILENFSPLILR